MAVVDKDKKRSSEKWHTTNLAGLVPALDPGDNQSLISKTMLQVDNVTDELDEGMRRVNNVADQVSKSLASVASAGAALRDVQRKVDELINNAANTGLFYRFLGSDLSVNGVQSLSARLHKALIVDAVPPPLTAKESEELTQLEAERRGYLRANETPPGHITNRISKLQPRVNGRGDPRAPRFTGETARVGSVLVLAGGANPEGLWEQLLKIKAIIPILSKDIVDFGREGVQDIADHSVKVGTDVMTDSSLIAEAFANKPSRIPLVAKSAEEAFEGIGFSVDTSDTSTREVWHALKVTDIFPFLDPNLKGSMAESLVNLEQNLVNNVGNLLSSANGINTRFNQLLDDVASLQAEVHVLANRVNTFAENVGATGLYMHTYGFDEAFPIRNNDELHARMIESLYDESDTGRPNFRGAGSVIAGFMFVVGAPTAQGLQEKVKTLGPVFSTIGLNLKETKRSAQVAQAGFVSEFNRASIDELSVNSVMPGDTLIIKGKNFRSTNLETEEIILEEEVNNEIKKTKSSKIIFTNRVEINGVRISNNHIESWTDTEIELTIPRFAKTGFVRVYTEINNEHTNGLLLRIPPTIKRVASNPTTPGSSINISGNRFGSEQNRSIVRFNNENIKVNSWSDTSISFDVPDNAATVSEVQVIINVVDPRNERERLLMNSQNKSVIVGPIITKVQSILSNERVIEDETYVGATIEIEGLGFGTSGSKGEVRIGRTVIENIESWTNNKITFIMPRLTIESGPVIVTILDNIRLEEDGSIRTITELVSRSKFVEINDQFEPTQFTTQGVQ